MRLHIAEGFSLPIDFTTQTQAILAKKRSGKSYCASVQAEELLKAGQQICIVDPTGAHWGLKSSADGKHAGFQIAIFGGEHADVPLEENAGEVIATALVEQRFSAILDLSLFRKGQINRFMTPFLETLYRLNREAMHLFVDEADAIAPQKPFGEEARMLGAIEDVVRRGGIRGIGTTLISQRPAVVNKNVLTQCEILTALRIVHHKDIAAIREWIEVHADIDLANEMIASLPALPIGTAWMWAPGWGDIFQRIQIRKKETFDSGATPKAGEVQRKPKVLADVDIAKLGQQIASTVQKAKENDPAALKRRIAELEKQAAAKPVAVKSSGKPQLVERIDRAKLAETVREEVEQVVRNVIRPKLEQAYGVGWRKLAATARELADRLEHNAEILKDGEQWNMLRLSATAKGAVSACIVKGPAPVAPPTITVSGTNIRVHQGNVPLDLPRTSSNGNAADLSRPQLKLLQALAECESIGRGQVSRSWLAFIAGVSPLSSGFEKNVSTLSSHGMVSYPTGGKVALTPEGRGLTSPVNTPPTTEVLLDRVSGLLSGPQAELLRILHRRHPNSLSREDLAAEANVSSISSGYEKNVSTLSGRELVTYPQPGAVRCADWLFVE